MIELLIMFVKILITFVASFVFGLDRQKDHKPIGFGTFIFVAVGSCGIGITAITLQPDAPIALLGAAVTGIGFLGAGALIRNSDKISGFTSAASIWVFAIFGISIGVGEYALGVLIYAVILVVRHTDKYLEENGIGSYQKKIVINTNKIVSEKDIESLIAVGTVKFKKVTIDLNKKENTLSITYLIEGRKEDINHIPQRLYDKPWFSSFKVD